MNEVINNFMILSKNHVSNSNRQHYYNVQCLKCKAIKVTTLSNLKKTSGCKVCNNNKFIGRKYNSLTIIEKIGIKNHNTNVLCKCDCGKTTTTSLSNLVSGRHKSCGCIRRLSYMEA